MLRKFLVEYDKKLDFEMRSFKSLKSIDTEISEKYSGKNYGASIISFHINAYKEYLIELSDLSCDLLKIMMTENKINKVRRKATINKIKQNTLGRLRGGIREVNESHIPELLARYNGNSPPGIKISATISGQGLVSIQNDTEKRIEIIINDYNKNPQNFIGRNKDKILIGVLIFLITTVITIFFKLFGII